MKLLASDQVLGHRGQLWSDPAGEDDPVTPLLSVTVTFKIKKEIFKQNKWYAIDLPVKLLC